MSHIYFIKRENECIEILKRSVLRKYVEPDCVVATFLSLWLFWSVFPHSLSPGANAGLLQITPIVSLVSLDYVQLLWF